MSTESTKLCVWDGLAQNYRLIPIKFGT